MVTIDPEKKSLRIEGQFSCGSRSFPTVQAGMDKIMGEVKNVIRALCVTAEAGKSEIQKQKFWKQVKAELKKPKGNKQAGTK